MNNDYLSIIKGEKNLFKKVIQSFFIVTALTLTACDKEKVLEEVESFDKVFNQGIELIPEYYLTLQDRSLDLYFQFLELYPEYEVGDKIRYVLEGEEVFSDSPLGRPVFPHEAIQLRVELLQTLADYSKNLALVAEDDSSEEFEGNVTALKDRLIALETSFKTATEQENSTVSSSKKYLDPISSVIAVFGKFAIEEAQWDAIRTTIIEAEAPIDLILEAIAVDLDNYVVPIQSAIADDFYTSLIDYYNRNRKTLTTAQRVEVLEEIRESKNVYDYISLHPPSDIPRQLKEVHSALVDTAESDGGLADLAQLESEINRFEREVEKTQSALTKISGE